MHLPIQLLLFGSEQFLFRLGVLTFSRGILARGSNPSHTNHYGVPGVGFYQSSLTSKCWCSGGLGQHLQGEVLASTLLRRSRHFLLLCTLHLSLCSSTVHLQPPSDWGSPIAVAHHCFTGSFVQVPVLTGFLAPPRLSKQMTALFPSLVSEIFLRSSRPQQIAAACCDELCMTSWRDFSPVVRHQSLPPINSGAQFQTHVFGSAKAICLLGDDVFLSLCFIHSVSDITARGGDVSLGLSGFFLVLEIYIKQLWHYTLDNFSMSKTAVITRDVGITLIKYSH